MHDLAQRLDITETELFKLLRSFTLAQLSHKQEQTWSVLELVEHIYITESVIYAVIAKPSEVRSESIEIIGGNRIKEILLEKSNRKIQTLESLNPKGVFKELETFEKAFVVLREKIKNDLQSGKISIDNRIFKHPYLGDMTISDWLNFMVYHTQRHIEQIRERLKKGALNYVLIIHEVENYPAWKKIFDDAAAIRKEAGEISYQVLKYGADANKIVHLSVWTTHEEARAFFESPKLVQLRKEAGVKAPEFNYLEEIEKGLL